MKKRHFRFSTALLVLVFLVGLSLLLYPTVSNYWNEMHQTKAITSYVEQVSAISEETYNELWNEAKNYNSGITSRINRFVQSETEKAQYANILNIMGNGIMGYVEIPSIDVSLPIYHGTSDLVLQSAAGHLEWTSLPVGGESTHCVLSGHRGLPSAKLFTNLDKLTVGDCFVLNVLNETLTYEVDQILIVDPKDISALQIVDGEDYCTLVTCTPYGINTHRLLVRGRRVMNSNDGTVVRVTSDAIQIEPLIVAPIMAIPILFVFLIAVLILDRKQRRDSRMEENDDD